MVAFKQWYDSVGADKFQNIIEIIEDSELPYRIKEKILNIVVDAEVEIVDNMYEGFVSDCEDRYYDEYKDSKYE